MREIKFRAWDNRDKKWLLTVNDSRHTKGFSLFGECMLLGEWSNILDEFIFKRESDDLIVEQYIGSKDKNDIEIYEGDIIIDYDFYEAKSVIKWNNGCKTDLHYNGFYAFARSGITGIVSGSVEVIGNIHENPGLLEDRK